MKALLDIRDWALRFHGRYLINVAVRVPSAHPARLPLLSWRDLPYVAGIGAGRWLRHLRWFRAFQANLTISGWTSLCDLYPRHMLLLYFYMLFMWARLCGVLEQVLASPDACVAAELFIRYNCELDRQVDCPEGPGRLLAEPMFARRAEGTRALAAEFWAAVHAGRRPRQAERQVVRLFQGYRQTFLCIMQRTAQPGAGSAPPARVFEDKARVAGDLWAVWGRMLGVLYGVPPERAEAGAEMLFAFGMITQLADDLWDLPEDRRNGQPNLLEAIAAGNPLERARLDAHLEHRWVRYLDPRWARAYLPETYGRARKLIADYLAAIERLDETGCITGDARRCAGAMTNG